MPKPGSTAARGYGAKHQTERKRWKQIVDAGQGHCWRCGKHIPPGAPFDLGHDDNDRTIYRGAECRPCNRATSGRRKKPRRWIL